MMSEIEELKALLPGDVEDMRLLMCQLSPRLQLSAALLEQVVSAPGSHLYVVRREGHIVACATLCVFRAPSSVKASIEDVVVHADYRGQGLGRMLLDRLLYEARVLSPIEVQLTSKPARVAANRLYQSMGFQRKETNVYRLSL